MINFKALDVCDPCYIFLNYYKIPKKKSYENQIVWFIIIIIIIITLLLMEAETISMSSHMLNWRWKMHNTQKQSGMSFHHISKESKQMIWWKDKKQNNSYKGTTFMHHRRVCYSDHRHVPEYPFDKIQSWTAQTYLLPVSYQYLWLGYSWYFWSYMFTLYFNLFWRK